MIRRLIHHPATVIVLAVAMVLSALVVWRMDGETYTVTARFDRAVGVYEGSDVRVLGIEVGEITSVEPTGTTVTVTMAIDADYPLPADARATVIPPSIVADRYIQFDPPYTGGARLAEGTVLDTDRTAVPLEVDEVYAALDDLAVALSDEEALADALEVAAENLDGNGEALGDSLDNLATVTDTLNAHSDDLFATIDSLAELTEMLADNDAQVQLFNEQLAEVSTQLAGEDENLSAALTQLVIALDDIKGFIDDNAESLTGNVDQLNQLAGTLASQQEALITILDYAPVALVNLDLAYNARSGTLDTRDDLLGAYDPATFLCVQLVHALAVEEVPQACFDLVDTLNQFGLEIPDELAALVGSS